MITVNVNQYITWNRNNQREVQVTIKAIQIVFVETLG